MKSPVRLAPQDVTQLELASKDHPGQVFFIFSIFLLLFSLFLKQEKEKQKIRREK